jgi:hypothetical protein
MAESSATAAAPPAVAAEREALLATKLNVPGSRPGLVPRPRLRAAAALAATGLLIVALQLG